MTDESFIHLTTSIDENDIEILGWNGESEIEETHRSVRQSHSRPPLTRQDSEDIEDETLTERLIGLTEMFPDWFNLFFSNVFQSTKSFYPFLRRTFWFCSSSFMILLLPILVQLEYSQMIESELTQNRLALLGPTARIGSN